MSNLKQKQESLCEMSTLTSFDDSLDCLLRIVDLSIVYKTKRGDLQAVSHASLSIRPGESVALIGESGCGKTTLATAIVGIQPLAASIVGGHIWYRQPDGSEIDLVTLKSSKMRPLLWSEIVMMFQASQSSFNPVRKVYTQFLDTARAHGSKLSDQEILTRSMELLELVMLDADKVLNSFPFELSGGMKQRTLLALSLLLSPRLVILDEPTTALDLLTQEKILELLNRLRAQFGFSMLFITHDLGIVSELADTVVTMYAGKVIERASVMEYFHNVHHPYSDGLLRAVPRLSMEFSELYSIPGTTPDLIDRGSGCLFAPRCSRRLDICVREEPQEANMDGHRFACFNPIGLVASGQGIKESGSGNPCEPYKTLEV